MTFRRMTLPSGMWRWYAGRSNVLIHSPARVKYVVATWTLLGITPDVWDRGQWKKTSDGMVTPADVRRYIEAMLDNSAAHVQNSSHG